MIHDLPDYMFNQRTLESVVSKEQIFTSTQLAVEALIKPGNFTGLQLSILE